MLDAIVGRNDRLASPHRSDIQGLRALAVAAVIAYHAHLPGIPGGFVGVDVFFVISGYLICGLLHRELSGTGRIDLTQFWLRRARRLLPNACLTLLVTLAAGAVILPGYKHGLLATAVAMAALYSANIYFASKAVDYFAEDEAPSPSLHFWSLSVEEQFYIAWPLALTLLVAVLRRDTARAAVWLMAAVCVASFVAAQIALQSNQPLAFYHGEMRAWQLATGGLLAVFAPELIRLNLRVRAIVAWAGLSAIVASILLFSDALHYPGFWALVPTLGCAAVLAGPDLGAGWRYPASLLSLVPLRWVGDRSYSLYLWHWPALVLTQAALPQNALAVPLALVAGIALALTSYALVETPLRSSAFWPKTNWRAFATAAAGIAMVLACSYVLERPLGKSKGKSAAMTRMIKSAMADRGRQYTQKCHREYDQTSVTTCVFGDLQAHRTAALLGDSHAAQWFEALDIPAKANGWKLLPWTKSACPAADVPTWHQKKQAVYEACGQWRQTVLARLTTTESRPDIVFIASSVKSAGGVWSPQAGSVLPKAESVAAWRDGLVSTIRQLQAAGVKPVLIADTPWTDPDYRDCLSSLGATPCARPRAEAFGPEHPDLDAARLTGIDIIDPNDRICDGASCPVMKNGKIIYRDRNHLTATFVKTLSAMFEPFLPAAAPSAPNDELVVGSISQLRGTAKP